MKFATRLLHNGNEIDPGTGAASIPLYQASTFHQSDLDHPGPYDYGRSGNPTRHALEQTLAELEGGCRGFAFASGMAAISTALLLFSKGDRLIVSQDLYGGTYRLLTEVLPRLGIRADFVDTTELDRVEAVIGPDTRGIYIETPSNPTLKVTDLGGITRLAKEHGLLTLVDNTFLTPCLQRPLEWGADLVIHSATKFISGHSDVVSGAVVVKEKGVAERIAFLQNTLGSILGVQDSWLTLRGLKTLTARMAAAQAAADRIARELERIPEIRRVYYTGLENHPGHRLQAGQADGHGAVLSFDLGSEGLARKVLSRVQLPLVAVSLGAVESILSWPARMSHAAMSREERLNRGVTDGLLRLSVGLEDPGDLLEDLDRAIRGRRIASAGIEWRASIL
ncbi:aminotransferase class I/II-fold pyridoxal phosphate-dependent enzyme [Kroppenstedtia eburnea]|uniref:cysteine-S-conjugate beta-lyase n=1 Tax=Kroppenstedtia eburnea TaxID=714067 RepID=A0A1N7KX08_9BACL|nr:aminotransferase class I/II-fold pyridoxal phosphate-dependent enzyme [Kroppenstedtia eburnea]EGK12586.1 cystathionine beta-lyase [Desmospora sp. 8437]QKI82770.1 aminotransferase class I/II-fold pyridoxal phosphate-dependent enzyme [Kroppenstedtia eburnea]SIS66104.1 cystathionine beta-lyase [Kroppenstedtia eburnea]